MMSRLRRSLNAPLLAIVCLVVATLMLFTADFAVAQQPPNSGSAISLDPVMRLYHSDVRELAFSDDGKMLATVGNDNRIRLWNVADGEPIAELYHNEPRKVVFSSDGKTLATSGNDNYVSLWQVPGTSGQ